MKGLDMKNFSSQSREPSLLVMIGLMGFALGIITMGVLAVLYSSTPKEELATSNTQVVWGELSSEGAYNLFDSATLQVSSVWIDGRCMAQIAFGHGQFFRYWDTEGLICSRGARITEENRLKQEGARELLQQFHGTVDETNFGTAVEFR